jgi:ribose transport system substrate-binding protein
MNRSVATVGLGAIRVLSLVLLFVASSSATLQAADKRIILLTNGNSPFWDACRFGLQAGEKEFKLGEAGLKAVMEVNDGTPRGQIDKLRQFASQNDIVGIAVSALDADNAAVVEEMRKLRKKGVHIICVDADVNRERFRDARPYYIGTDNLKGGIALGIAGKGVLESRGFSKGSYVQFVGRTGSHNARERMDGFAKAVGSTYKDADRMGDDLDRTKARENVRNAITNHKDLVALVGIWSYNAPAIVDVCKEKGLRKNPAKATVVVTFDAEPIAIKQMGEGQIDGMVVQNPYDMGYQAVRLLKAMIQDDKDVIKAMFPNEGKPDGDLYDTGLKVVVPDNGSPLKQEMFESNVQFLSLKTFKDWLAKYDLKGS